MPSDLYNQIISQASGTPILDAYYQASQERRTQEDFQLEKQMKSLNIQKTVMEIEDYIADAPVRAHKREQEVQGIIVGMDKERREMAAQQLASVYDQTSYDQAKGKIQQLFPDLNIKMLGLGESYDSKSKAGINRYIDTSIHSLDMMQQEHLLALKEEADRRAGGGKKMDLKNVINPDTGDLYTGRWTGSELQIKDRGQWVTAPDGYVYTSFQDNVLAAPSTAEIKNVYPQLMLDDEFQKFEPEERATLARAIAHRAEQLMEDRVTADLMQATQMAKEEVYAAKTQLGPNWIGSIQQFFGAEPSKWTQKREVSKLPEGLDEITIKAAMDKYGVDRETVINRYKESQLNKLEE